MSPITGIAHIGIRVHALDRATAFYELLGFELVAGPVGPEPVAILRHPAGIEINLVLNATDADAPNVLMDVPQKSPGYTHVALLTDDFDAALAHLAAQGVALSGGPVERPNGSRSLFMRDPDRNVVEICSAATAR